MKEWSSFIWQHRLDDPAQLALSAKKYPDRPISYIARQVEALRKIQKKIPSWYREGMEFPFPLSIEQASSEATARFKAGLTTGGKMADLSCGLGVDAYFFSQKARRLDVVERDPEILRAAQANFRQLGVENTRFFEGDAATFLRNAASDYDWIYVDPARRDMAGGKLFNLADCSPNVLEIKQLLLEKSAKVLLKTAPFLDIKLAVQQLMNVSRIWVTAFDGECRELLFLLGKDAVRPEKIPVHAVSLNNFGEVEREFEGSWEEESCTASTFSAPLHYLYEPGPEVMKTGFFKSFGRRYGLNKLHPNTHLFTSREPVEGVPGRSFLIRAICRFDKKEVQAALPEGKANLATRNFPESTDQVRRRLSLRDGGDNYVFAATDQDEKKIVLVCNKY